MNIAYFCQMERSLRLTEDGSHTVYVDKLDEPYHSSHGALQESMHVFIKQGLHTTSKAALRILEIGFGTGLNALLTLRFARQMNIEVHYHAVEKYPFDAFSPDKQPELWSRDVFVKIENATRREAVLVTYSSKGRVRRALKTCGFKVEKVPGPPGKLEMIRAVRI